MAGSEIVTKAEFAQMVQEKREKWLAEQAEEYRRLQAKQEKPKEEPSPPPPRRKMAAFEERAGVMVAGEFLPTGDDDEDDTTWVADAVGGVGYIDRPEQGERMWRPKVQKFPGLPDDPDTPQSLIQTEILGNLMTGPKEDPDKHSEDLAASYGG